MRTELLVHLPPIHCREDFGMGHSELPYHQHFRGKPIRGTVWFVVSILTEAPSTWLLQFDSLKKQQNGSVCLLYRSDKGI